MTPEQRIKNEIKRFITAQKGFWSVIQGGPYSKPGDPDIVCCIKGLYVAIEAKTINGRLSDMQILRGKEIERAGGIWIVARSVGDVESEFRRRGLIENGDQSRVEEITL